MRAGGKPPPPEEPAVCRLCGSRRVSKETSPAGGTDALAKLAPSFDGLRAELVIIRKVLETHYQSAPSSGRPGSALRMVPYLLFDRTPFIGNTAETWPPGVHKWATMDDADEWYIHVRNSTNQAASIRVKSNDGPSSEGANNILRAAYALAAGGVVAILGQGQWYPYLTATVQFTTAPTSGYVYLTLIKRLQ